MRRVIERVGVPSMTEETANVSNARGMIAEMHITVKIRSSAGVNFRARLHLA